MNTYEDCIVVVFFFYFGLDQMTGQVEARLHQVFEAASARKVVVGIDDSNYEVNIKETYSTVIIVEIIIALNQATPLIMEDLIQQGRYDVHVTEKNGEIIFSTTKDRPAIIIGDKEAEEYVIYNIAIPEYLEH